MATDLATTEGLEPLNRCHFDPETVTHALTTVALAGGNCERAADRLEEQGIDVTPQTLRSWRARYPNRYREACTDVAPKVEANVLHLHREIAAQGAETVLKAIAIESARLDRGEVDNAARTAKDLSTAAAIAVDKVQAIQGRPTSVIEHRTADQAINRLQSLGVVDTTAIDITDTRLNSAAEPNDAEPLALPQHAASSSVRENKRARTSEPESP